MKHYPDLNAEKAWIWRIVHRDNLPWILDNGLHCGNSEIKAPTWVNIGNVELIGRRGEKSVPIPPGGALNDYIPFYFTPFSPMLYNIYTGRGGVQARPNEEIVILVSSLHKLVNEEYKIIFSDRHAYVATAQFFNDLNQLDVVDWPLLQARNFQRSPDDPEKVERYQAEALVWKHLPVSGLVGAICYTSDLKKMLQQEILRREIDLSIYKMTGWYF